MHTVGGYSTLIPLYIKPNPISSCYISFLCITVLSHIYQFTNITQINEIKIYLKFL
ncbi:hypothetical protein RchiOBHm_Chr2g0173641 [Rosa chinensis]|uniref:Uncharacterized protein n=1 Tax=Rosa chinensis TaxID=74649 RepID=A0A2P6S5Y5_ROSCH|nr:hypothetical protein RchiOBHm_Chr2g0173641 [Rosa chinensis]